MGIDQLYMHIIFAFSFFFGVYSGMGAGILNLFFFVFSISKVMACVFAFS
jgi:hypothetical protein